MKKQIQIFYLCIILLSIILWNPSISKAEGETSSVKFSVATYQNKGEVCVVISSTGKEIAPLSTLGLSLQYDGTLLSYKGAKWNVNALNSGTQMLASDIKNGVTSEVNLALVSVEGVKVQGTIVELVFDALNEKQTATSFNLAFREAKETSGTKITSDSVQLSQSGTIVLEESKNSNGDNNGSNGGSSSGGSSNGGGSSSDSSSNNNSGNTSTPDTRTDFHLANNKNDSAIYSIALSNSTYIYNGKTRKPTVTVERDSTTLKQGVDYTCIYSNNKNIGTAKVTIKGIGKYAGTMTKTFHITLPKGSIYTVQNIKCKVTNAGTNGTVSIIGTTYKKTDKKFITFDTRSTVKIGGKTYKITEVGKNAFKDYKYLKTIVIGQNIKTIDSKAFYGCKKIKSIQIKSS